MHRRRIADEVTAQVFRQSENRPDANPVAGDLAAPGVLDALRARQGVSVPGDMSVAGFDDVSLADRNAYDLTACRQPVERMGGGRDRYPVADREPESRMHPKADWRKDCGER